MSDPRDIDEDAILKGLSAEELDQLEYELQEMDPEVRRFGFSSLCHKVSMFTHGFLQLLSMVIYL